MLELSDFRFTLARELGKTLSEIDELPLSELHEWFEYSQRKPFLVDRVESLLATLTAITFNINSKNTKLRPLDFFVSIDEDTKKHIKQKELSNNLMGFMRSNAKIIKKV